VFSSNYELYGDISTRVMSILKTYEADVEIYSVDESFLKLYKPTDYKALGQRIKADLFQQLHMPVCAGFAPTKTLAKLANRVAKKKQQLSGVCVLDTPEKWEWVLLRSKTRDIWGVGEQTSAKLAAMGIQTAWQLAKSDPKWIRKAFGVVLERTVRELNGEACLPLELEPQPKQQIIHSRSFSQKITELPKLEEAISQYAARACEKLRKQNGLVRAFSIFALGGRFSAAPYTAQRVITLPHYSNDTRVVAEAARKAMAGLFREGIKFYKCGIILMDLSTSTHEQLHLFLPQQSESSRQLMSALDKLNARYGQRTVFLANSGVEQKWTMQRSMMSPAYTTRWAELPVAT
jgi:DNA polymerase V